MKVSVVVPVYNNERTLARCLRALEESTHLIEEIIVVDDGSTDRSCEVAARFSCKLVRLPANVGVGVARNAGARAACGDVLFFTDGDVTVGANTIAVGVQRLAIEPGIAAVVGLYAKECGAEGFFSVFKNLVYHHVHMTSSDESSVFIGNCGMIRREVFEVISGFDETSEFRYVLEDVDLGMRLVRAGHRIALDKRMQVVHHRNFSFFGLIHSDLFKRAIPWTKLILRHRGVRFDNCTRGKDLFCLLAAQLTLCAAMAAASAGTPGLVVAGVAFTSFVVADLELLLFLSCERGRLFAVKAAGMRYLYYLLSGLGAAAAWVSYAFRFMATEETNP